MALLQAALNGPRTKEDHPAVPSSPAELARDAVACVAAGAAALHLHPRDAEGRERLDPEVVQSAVAEIRASCGVPVGVSTGAWIEPDLERRLAHVRAWRGPDYASVNVEEDGFADVMRALLEAGVGIEAGVWSVEDAERLAASGLGGRVLRVLVEIVEPPPEGALQRVADIHRALEDHGLTAPRLQHGEGEVAWAVLTDAVRRGLDTRAGLEDMLTGPDGGPVAGNAAVIGAARELGAG